MIYQNKLDQTLDVLNRGQFILLHDSSDRENEVDMVIATKNLDEIRRLRKLGCDFPRILDNNTPVNEFTGLPIKN